MLRDTWLLVVTALVLKGINNKYSQHNSHAAVVTALVLKGINNLVDRIDLLEQVVTALVLKGINCKGKQPKIIKK